MKDKVVTTITTICIVVTLVLIIYLLSPKVLVYSSHDYKEYISSDSYTIEIELIPEVVK